MPHVNIPENLRPLTGGAKSVVVPGNDIGEMLDSLEARFPGIGQHLREGDSLSPTLMVCIRTIGAEVGVVADSLSCHVGDNDEIIFANSMVG
jgi:molybdopterin converting factor small subunit